VAVLVLRTLLLPGVVPLDRMGCEPVLADGTLGALGPPIVGDAVGGATEALGTLGGAPAWAAAEPTGTARGAMPQWSQ